nr:mechanosensitive ion channel protein 10-like [Ipomoea batatas]
MDSSGEFKKSCEVAVLIHGDDKDSRNNPHELHLPDGSRDQKGTPLANSPQRVSLDSSFDSQKGVPVNGPSPEMGSHNKPPRIPGTDTLTRRKSFSKSVYSRSKSRFGEQSVPIDPSMFEENYDHDVNSPWRSNASSRASPKANVGQNAPGVTQKEFARTVSVSVMQKTPVMASPGRFGGVDEHEAIYNKVNIRKKLRLRKVKLKVLMDWLVFLSLLGFLIASLTTEKLQNLKIWELEMWKWVVLVMVIISGMLVSKWLIHFIALLIELNFLLKKKVLYFVYGLKKIVQVFIWLSWVLVTWVLLFTTGVRRTHLANKILDYITWTIVSLLIGAFLWLLKTLLLKILAASFHVNTFFDRIQESLFHQYILLTLSGLPVMESAQMAGGGANSTTAQLSFDKPKKGRGKEKKQKEVVDMNKLHQMKRDKVSAWTMKMLVDVISNSGLCTLSGAFDESAFDGENDQADKQITNEEEAIAAAYHIFRNVARYPNATYIDEYDLMRFMIKEEVDLVFQMIDVADTGQIHRKALMEWVVKVYNGRKALSHALNDTKTAVRQLNKLVTVVLIVIIVIVWLLLIGIATTKVLVFLSSQLVVAAFMFGNTCKVIFEAIVFVFVMHPFDVGDRCVIDGIQMTVEEMNILNTVFLRYDNEKIYYPNTVLATKPISNFYRSPDMSDCFEFSLDFRTPLEKIGALKERVKIYLEKSSHWHINHNVVVKEIENMNKIKMALFFNHTMNFQDIAEKNRRRTELILEMKKVFEDLDLRYDLLPQEVHLVESRAAALGSK